MAVPIVADGLGNRDDMGLGERAMQRGTTVAAGAEDNHLVGVAYIGLVLVILLLQLGHVNQQILGGGFARQRRDCCHSRRHVHTPALWVCNSLPNIDAGASASRVILSSIKHTGRVDRREERDALESDGLTRM